MVEDQVECQVHRYNYPDSVNRMLSKYAVWYRSRESFSIIDPYDWSAVMVERRTASMSYLQYFRASAERNVSPGIEEGPKVNGYTISNIVILEHSNKLCRGSFPSDQHICLYQGVGGWVDRLHESHIDVDPQR